MERLPAAAQPEQETARRRPPALRAPLRQLASALGIWLTACGGRGATAPSASTASNLPALPRPISPNGQVSSDSPVFKAENARGFDGPAAQYTFEVVTSGRGTLLASTTVAGGSGTTEATFGARLPRGMALAWRVSAHTAVGSATSGTLPLRLPAVECEAARDPYAKAVVDSYLSECSRSRNSYNNPRDVLGRPNAGRDGGRYFGFMSLGEKGSVTVDMGGCVVNGPAEDVRVFQAVSREPVTLYAAGTPEGPFILIGDRIPCGDRSGNTFSGSCDFDFGAAEVDEARYLKIEDGELFPCDRGNTDTEGADIDAIEALNFQ